MDETALEEQKAKFEAMMKEKLEIKLKKQRELEALNLQAPKFDLIPIFKNA